MQIKRLFKRPARTSVVPRAIRYRERFEFAIAISLLLHALILALRFGAPGFGLPWFEEERPQPPAMTLQRSDTLKLPEPSPETAPVNAELASPPPNAARSRAPLEVRLVQAAPPPAPAPVSAPSRETRKPAPAAKARARDRQVKPKPAPRMLAQSKPQPDTFKVPAPKRAEPEPQRAPEAAGKAQAEEQRPAEQVAEQTRREAEDAARIEAEEAARQRAEEEARQRALAAQKEAEAKKLAEAKRLEEARKEEARKEEEAKRLAQIKKEEEAKKLEEARKLEIARKEEEAKKEEERKQAQIRKEEEERRIAQLKKEEEGRRIRIEIEALKRAEELAKMQAEARRRAEEAAKAKEAAERQRAEAEAAQRDRERLARKEGPVPAPGALSGLDIAAKAREQLRTPGSLRGDPAGPPTAGVNPEKPRRRSLIGIERDVSLRAYVDSWRWKIERGGNLNYRVSAGMRARENPIVTVAIRSDGSLEEVRINRSSGVREIDQAVLRIAELYAPYSKFPPDLARQYDVIEIRRVWLFDNTLKILDEM